MVTLDEMCFAPGGIPDIRDYEDVPKRGWRRVVGWIFLYWSNPRSRRELANKLHTRAEQVDVASIISDLRCHTIDHWLQEHEQKQVIKRDQVGTRVYRIVTIPRSSNLSTWSRYIRNVRETWKCSLFNIQCQLSALTAATTHGYDVVYCDPR